MTRQEIQFLNRPLSMETGRIARQAHGAIWLQHGSLVILATAVSPDARREGLDFFPLSVEYRERLTAVGKFPGGYIKREGRPTEKETVTARCIDRPMRPLFPKDYYNEVQIIVQVFSADPAEDPDTMGITAASAALCMAGLPFAGPIAAVRVSKIDGELQINVPMELRERSTLNFVVAGSRDKVVMIEGEAMQAPEDEVYEAICFGHKELQPLIDIQEELVRNANVQPRSYTPVAPSAELRTSIEALHERVLKALHISGKQERNDTLKAIRDEHRAAIATDEAFADTDPMAYNIAYDELQVECVREIVLKESSRLGGRGFDEVRPITCEVGLLPRTHGSALFTRGETQSVAVCTLGTSRDEQSIELLSGESSKRFMLHYTFPPYSVGEARMIRGPGRREIGHGNLAERSLKSMVPKDFTYTIRLTSDITESNGSSSMASVCAGCLALMDAGVPMAAPVAGISVGLIENGDERIMLTDITGDEDHFGDMDFKVAGTAAGVTGVQVDFKLHGLSPAFIKDILERARSARMKILESMAQTLAGPRAELSPYAPVILTASIPVDKIGALIGPGGKNIRKIQEETKTSISIEDDGTVQIAGDSHEAAEAGRQIVLDFAAEAEIGKIYDGTVMRLMSFGAFVRILPDTEGMVHISEICEERVESIEDKLNVGDAVRARVIEVDDRGRVNLSMRFLDGEFNPEAHIKRSQPRGDDRRSGDRGSGDRRRPRPDDRGSSNRRR
jgi:polyribonucleotide nucleotidyltransferase